MAMQQQEQVQQANRWSWGAKLLLLFVVLTASLLTWQATQPWVHRPLAQIILQTDIPATDKVTLQKQLNAHLSDSFFGADLEEIRLEVENHPWVSDAKVSRVWPNRLMVEASPQIFMARWFDGGFVNHEGQVVLVDPGQVVGADQLPVLDGPADSAWIMSELFRQMSWLVGRDELAIDQMTMARRGAVELRLDNGIILVLGRDQVLPRLKRLMKVYHRYFVTKADAIERIDGRYVHGVSVAWKDAS
ncbi:MAG: cell division protein FtsQ/DivIB [Oceanospirillaceae bacterium]|nr:cell division protein FtsQ/DivIB [Oceanospirillaceae bacterium]